MNEVDFDKVIESIQSASWVYFLIAILCYLLSHVSRGIRWAILLEDQGMTVNKFGLIMGTYFGYFINIIFPRGGEVARASAVSYKYGLPTDKLLGTIVLERVIDFAILVSLVVLILFLDLELFGNFFLDRLEVLKEKSGFIPILIGLALLGVISLFLLFKLRNRIPLFSKVFEFIRGIFEGLVSLRKLKRKWSFILHTLFIWFMYLMMTYLPFKAFAQTEDYNLINALFVFILGGIGMTIPAPGGIGPYHYAVILGMTTVLGETEDVAGAYAFSVHGIITLLTILIGIISSIFIFKGKKHEALNKDQQ